MHMCRAQKGGQRVDPQLSKCCPRLTSVWHCFLFNLIKHSQLPCTADEVGHQPVFQQSHTLETAESGQAVIIRRAAVKAFWVHFLIYIMLWWLKPKSYTQHFQTSPDWFLSWTAVHLSALASSIDDKHPCPSHSLCYYSSFLSPLSLCW